MIFQNKITIFMLGLTICLTVPHINAMHVNNEPRDSK